MRSSTPAFKFQYILFSLKSSSSCLRLLHRFLFPFHFSFSKVFSKTIQLVFLFLLDIRGSFLLRSSSSSFFTRSDQLTSPSFSSTTFHKFHSTSDPFSELSKFQYHKKLCSKCSISLRISSWFNPLTRSLKNCSSPSSDVTVDISDTAASPVVQWS